MEPIAGAGLSAQAAAKVSGDSMDEFIAKRRHVCGMRWNTYERFFLRESKDSGSSTKRTVFPSGPATAFVLMFIMFIVRLKT